MRARGVIATALACALAAGVPAAAIATPSTKHCTSVRLDRFLHPAAHGAFGAFALTARATGCPTAHKVASKYVRDPYLVDSPAHRTSTVLGWRCTWGSGGQVAQQVTVRCRRLAARIVFTDKIPSG